MKIQSVLRVAGFEFRSDSRIVSSEFDAEATKFIEKIKPNRVPNTEMAIVLASPFTKIDPQVVAGIMNGDECVGLIPCMVLWLDSNKEVKDFMNGFIGQVPALEEETEEPTLA